MQIVRRDVCRKGARARPIFCRKHSNPKMAHTNNSADGGPDPRGAARAPLTARGRGARLRRTPDAGRRGPPRGHRTPRSGHRPREVARRRSRRSCLPWRSRSPSVRVATWGPDPRCALLLGGGTGDAGGRLDVLDPCQKLSLRGPNPYLSPAMMEYLSLSRYWGFRRT